MSLKPIISVHGDSVTVRCEMCEGDGNLYFLFTGESKPCDDCDGDGVMVYAIDLARDYGYDVPDNTVGFHRRFRRNQVEAERQLARAVWRMEVQRLAQLVAAEEASHVGAA